MQPAQDGVFKRCRGFAALLVALFGTFAAASRYDAGPSGAARSADTGGRFDDFQDWVARARPDTAAAEIDPGHLNATAEDDNVIETVDVGINAKAIFLPVTIDGQKWWFLVDTGCCETVVDREVAIHVGLIDRQDPKLKERWKGAYRTLNASVGKTRIPLKCMAMCFDLAHLRRCYNSFPLCGILGMDFLRRHVIGIDLDAGKLSFLKSVPESSGSQLKLSRDSDDCPILSVEIAKDKAVWFVVDTGCAGPYAGALEKSIFTDLLDQSHLTVVPGRVAIMTFYGLTICDQAKLDVFQIGSFEHASLKFHDDDSDNLLGMGYLSRYVVTLDFLNDSLYLKEGKRFAEPAASTGSRASAKKPDRTDKPAVHELLLKLGSGLR